MAHSPLTDVTLESKVAFLCQPTSFPDPTFNVEAVETHMSWVFLTDNYAYKLKKPVCYEFLDFSTLDSRHYFCEEEVRLNRRLAADVYLGVEPLTVDTMNRLQLGGPGKVIDWLVKMCRLPENQMLDYAIRNGEASEGDMDAVAARLAAFYRDSIPIAVDREQYRYRLLKNIDAHQQELVSWGYQCPDGQVETICSALRGTLQSAAALFDERAAMGKIIEGHGDLRPEHIFLRPNLVIIDCLEFSRELRIIDTADELAFLALECERLGAASLGQRLLETYRLISGDGMPGELVGFYQAYRAILRAAIALRHLKEERFRSSPSWRQRAAAYLKLAEQHILI